MSTQAARDTGRGQMEKVCAQRLNVPARVGGVITGPTVGGCQEWSVASALSSGRGRDPGRKNSKGNPHLAHESDTAELLRAAGEHKPCPDGDCSPGRSRTGVAAPGVEGKGLPGQHREPRARNEGETKAFKATPGEWDILQAVLEADRHDRRGGLRNEKGRRATMMV